ncbi:unnamed protein product [Leptosia nina]|uniref:Uncharacterized protein n=1 Tax=Leptosia nina TaxID=320188 RepID=A0AAV1J1I9_9NEOP
MCLRAPRPTIEPSNPPNGQKAERQLVRSTMTVVDWRSLDFTRKISLTSCRSTCTFRTWAVLTNVSSNETLFSVGCLGIFLISKQLALALRSELSNLDSKDLDIIGIGQNVRF